MQKEIELRKTAQEMNKTLIKNGPDTKVDQEGAANPQWMESPAGRNGSNGKAVEMKEENTSLCMAEGEMYAAVKEDHTMATPKTHPLTDGPNWSEPSSASQGHTNLEKDVSQLKSQPQATMDPDVGGAAGAERNEYV